MKYNTVEFIRVLHTGEVDALNNPVVGEAVEVVDGCRVVDWTVEDIAIYGREVTNNTCKLVVKPFSNMLNGLIAIRYGGVRFTVVNSMDLGRWVLLVLRGV